MRVYAVLQRDCSQAVDAPLAEGMRGDEAAFWQAAAHACVALRQSDDAAWRDAVGAWLGGGRGYAGGGCQIAEVRRTMQTIMGASPAPDLRPAIVLGDSSGGYACPPAHVSLSPTTGPPGTVVTLTWTDAPWMEYAGHIQFGNQQASLGGDLQMAQYTVQLAAPTNLSGTYDVTMTFLDGQTVNAGAFTYP